MTDVIVVGGGYAGLTAALYVARAGKSVIVFESENIGGQITAAHQIDNYPGFPTISGMQLADNLFLQATGQGVEVKLEHVLSIKDSAHGKQVTTDEDVYDCKAVILATGAKHKKLGIAREEDLTGNGISYCAVCDGMFFRDKDVAVIGGGNTAFGDALFLAPICKSVTIIHRRDYFRADASMVASARSVPNIHYLKGYRVLALQGDPLLTGITIGLVDREETMELPVDGLFVAIGHAPKNPDLPEGILVDEDGYLLAAEDGRTNTPGVFIAGDCRAKEVRQLTTATADGTNAAISAVRYIQCESSAGQRDENSETPPCRLSDPERS